MQKALAVALLVSGTLFTPGFAGAQEQGSFESIPWERGPVLGKLGGEATVAVSEGCVFTGSEGTGQYMTLLENPVNGDELGTVLCTMGDGPDNEHWFAVFEYDGIGYIKDDEKDKLDADALLKRLKEGNEAGNEERKKRGWTPIDLVGWAREPYYDPATNNLTWAIRLQSEHGAAINHSVRLLGRAGVMSVDLVVSPEAYAAAVPPFDALIAEHTFVPGKTYAEWKKGDKIAAYGLTALVAGGAGAALASSGYLAKFGKAIVAGLVALGVWLKSLFKKKD